MSLHGNLARAETTEARDALLPWKPHPRNPLVLVPVAFADEVLGAGARPPGSLRETRWRREEEKRGERDKGQEKERQEGRGDGETEREDDGRKERGEEGTRWPLRWILSSRGFAQQQRKYSVPLSMGMCE